MLKIGKISLDKVGWFFVINYFLFFLISDAIELLEFRSAFLSDTVDSFNFGTGLLPVIRLSLKFIILVFSLRCMLYRKVSFFTFFIYTFITYWVLTGFSYIDNGRPISLYIEGINQFLVPVLFYFVGIKSKDLSSQFYSNTLKYLSFAFLVGLFLHFSLSDWYIEWKIQSIISRQPSNYMVARNWLGNYGSPFHSFSGPYFVGYLSLIGLSFSYYYYSRKHSIRYLFAVLLFTLVMFLSQQRISMIVGGLLIFSYHVYGILRKRKHLNILLISYALILITFSIVFNDVFSEIIDKGFSRLALVFSGGAFSERSGQWFKLIESQTNYIFGHGLNSGGSMAFNLGFHGVHDGEFFKFLYEGGIVGFGIFLTINILTIIKSSKNLKQYGAELPIIMLLFIATIAANPFSKMPAPAMMYWFALGRIWSDNLIKIKENE